MSVRQNVPSAFCILAARVLVCACLALPAAGIALAEDSSVETPASPAGVAKDVGERALDGRNVVAHWRFQKGIAGSAADTKQVIEDSSGNNRHARAIGGPLYHSVELPTTNLALAFDGRDDRLAVADDPAFYLTKSFTIEAWVELAYYARSSANRTFIVFRGDDRAGFDPWFLAIQESGQLQFLMSNSLNEGSVVLSPEPLPTRKFLHVAAVFDHKSKTQSLFIDGKRVASAKTKIRSGGFLGGTRPGIGIGGRQDHSHQGFQGSIAELRICAVALSPTEFLLSPQESE